MNLQPRKTKYNKFNKGKAINKIISQNNLCDNNVSTVYIKTITHYKLNANLINLLYSTLNKIIKKSGTICIKVFPHVSVTKKPTEIRMGKGKGAVDHWICRLQPGTLLCKIETNNIQRTLKAISCAKFRLPIKIRACVYK